MELRSQCSSQCLASGLDPGEKKPTGSPGTIKFPALSIIHSNYYKCQIWRTSRSLSKLGRHVSDIIGLIERSGCQNDL